MEVDRNGLEVLDTDECVRLLRTRSVGRIGISSRALPTILPVEYLVAQGHVLFRTGLGTRLDVATRDAVVAFEVDEFDDASNSGWSVVVTGVAGSWPEGAGLPAGPAELARLRRWDAAADEHLVAIPLDRVSGRRLRPPVGGGRADPVT